MYLRSVCCCTDDLKYVQAKTRDATLGFILVANFRSSVFKNLELQNFFLFSRAISSYKSSK